MEVRGWIYRCKVHGYWESDENDFPDLCPSCNEIGRIVRPARTKVPKTLIERKTENAKTEKTDKA